MFRRHSSRLFAGAVLLALTAGTMMGCNTLEGNVAAGALGATVLAAQSPNNEIEQIYYFGVFDPREQLPPAVYRVRVHGQASFMSTTRFASGWVHASIIDSLGTSLAFNKDSGRIEIGKVQEDELTGFKTGRRLMMFGPEGFREAPRDHRLVIVMGASPDKWFEAMDQALAVVADTMSEQRSAQLTSDLSDAIVAARAEQAALNTVKAGLDARVKPAQTEPAKSAN